MRDLVFDVKSAGMKGMGMGNLTLVYLIEEKVVGRVLSEGADLSLIEYTIGGVEHQEYFLNTDFIVRAEIDIEEDEQI